MSNKGYGFVVYRALVGDILDTDRNGVMIGGIAMPSPGSRKFRATEVSTIPATGTTGKTNIRVALQKDGRGFVWSDDREAIESFRDRALNANDAGSFLNEQIRKSRNTHAKTI